MVEYYSSCLDGARVPFQAIQTSYPMPWPLLLSVQIALPAILERLDSPLGAMLTRRALSRPMLGAG